MFENATKIQKKKLFGSFAATALLGIIVTLTLVMYLNFTLGWFSNNRNVTGSGMGVRIESIDAEADYTVYIYNAKEQRVEYTGDSYPTDDPEIGDFKMQVHDVIFKSRNRYTPAVVRIHLSNIKEEYRGGGTLNITLTRDTSKAAYDYDESTETQMLNEYSTSVLRFTLARDSSWYSSNAKTLYFNLDAALYNNILAGIYTGVKSDVFTEVTGTGAGTEITKAESIVLSLAYTASDVVNGEMDAYLYITYDQELVDKFEQSSGIDTTGTTVGKISTMADDIDEIVVSFSAQS